MTSWIAPLDRYLRRPPPRFLKADEYMDTERLFGMFDAVASILFTVALATTGLSFLESEIVCETIRTAS
jgi:hypothetical protein